MKKIILFCITALMAQWTIAQDSLQKKILLVSISSAKDKYTRETYYKINADKGVPEASVIYNLKPVADLVEQSRKGYYLNREKVREDMEKINTDSVVYNYFESESAALNFVVINGWQLQSRESTLTSSGGTTLNAVDGKPGTYTALSSTIKYIFVRTGK
jgi:hypothetical protein